MLTLRFNHTTLAVRTAKQQAVPDDLYSQTQEDAVIQLIPELGVLCIHPGQL